jgi:hypothetical protein
MGVQMKQAIVVLGLTLGACSSGGDSSLSSSQRIVEGREIYAAAVDPALPAAKIAADAKALCKVGSDWCMIVLVPNGKALPSGFPITDAEMPSVLGFYTLNRATGVDEFKRQ